MTAYPSFCDQLRTAMTARGMNATDLSRATGETVSARTIRRWVQGETAPGVEALPHVARALGVSADFLVGLVFTDVGLKVQRNR